MRVRRVLLSLLVAVSSTACMSIYGVGHSTAIPADLDARTALRAVRSALAPQEVEEETDTRWSIVAVDGDAFVFGKYEDRGNEVYMWSSWPDSPPSPAVLERSLQLQLRFAEALRGCSVDLPPLREWRVEWQGMEPDDALRDKVLGR